MTVSMVTRKFHLVAAKKDGKKLDCILAKFLDDQMRKECYAVQFIMQ
jgi:hypothetical protein